MPFALLVLPDATSAGPRVERTSPRAVRLSVTDRCDMACVYCRPSHHEREGAGPGAHAYLAADERLDVDAWERVARGLVAAGVTRVRITGGEPLLFRGVVEVVRRLALLGVEDLALTTNASRLEALALPLREAGLRRLNVSLDSLDEERFRAVTRGGDLAGVLRGIERALGAGFDEVKLNTVVLRGVNDGEVESITRWAWARGITPRFLEVMGVGEGARIVRDALVPAGEVRARIAHLLRDEGPAREADRGPARYVRARPELGAHRVGFITGTSDTYCAGCDRLRVSSDGVLRPCLARPEGVPLGDALRGPDSVRHVGEVLERAWAQKPPDDWGGCTEPSAARVSMRATGG